MDFTITIYALLHLITIKVSDAFTTVTTSEGTYSLSSGTMDFTTAQTTCASIGLQVTSFSSNVEFERLTEYLNNNVATYDGMDFWVSLTVDTSTGSNVYRFGTQEVDSDRWFPFEPTESGCSPTCCYRIRNFRIPGFIETPFSLADISDCSRNYYVFCGSGTITTTTPGPTTTTNPPITTTTAPTTTTTAPTTTTTAPPTTTTAPTTTTTAPTTTTTAPPTTTTAPTTTTTAPTTTTTAPTTTTTSPMTTTTAPAAPTSIATTSTTAPPTTTAIQLALSTGQQMTVMYLGLIIGTSLGLSCCCSLTWLGINRYRRKYTIGDTGTEKLQMKDEENNAEEDSDSSSTSCDSISSSEED